MRLHLYRVDGGYLLCRGDVPVPEPHASELKNQHPDLHLLSRQAAGRHFIEDHMRNNGAVLMDQDVAELVLSGCPEWMERSF